RAPSALYVITRPAKLPTKIWGGACTSQKPLYAGHGAIRCIRRVEDCDSVSFKPDRVFCLCLVMAAELISLYEDSFQST
ncbi:MAG: hypothetical protein ACREDU_07365, partial [Methylocella sp.]